MNKQNFKNGNHRFPTSTDALDFMQNQILLVAQLTSIAGTNVIITPATTSTDGLVVIGGELLPLKKGTPKSYITIIETPESVTAAGVTFENIRIARYAEYSYSGYAVSGFTNIDSIVTIMSRISAIEGSYMKESAIRALVQVVQTNLNTTNNNLTKTNSNLATAVSNHNLLAQRVTTIESNYKTAAQINELLSANAQHHLPKGSIIDWYGSCRAANVPYGFVPCGMFGIDLTTNQSRDTELAAWKAKYRTISISKTGSNNMFLRITNCMGQTVPDLTDRFIVQAGCSYNLASIGGLQSVSLKPENIPSHKHEYTKVLTNGEGGTWLSQGNGVDKQVRRGSSYTGSGVFDNAGTIKTSVGNNGASHENRPPYFALYKLIKVI